MKIESQSERAARVDGQRWWKRREIKPNPRDGSRGVACAETAQTNATRDTIRRAAIIATNALMEFVKAGFPRHVYLPFTALEEIEANIAAVLERENPT